MAAVTPPSGPDPGAEAATRRAALDATKGSAPATSMDQLVLQILGGAVALAGKFLKVKPDSLLGGVNQGLERDAVTSAAVNPGGTTLAAKGGALAGIGSVLLGKEHLFAGLEKFPVEPVSLAQLGELPSPGPSFSVSTERSL